MTAQLSPFPVFKAWSNLGFPLVGGKLFTYVAGTTTKQATYTDSSQSTPNTNPVVLNFRGEANVWLDPSKTYKLVLAPATDTDPPTNPFWTVDQISGGGIFGFNLIPSSDNTYTLGSTSFSWANVYIGPNHAPVLDTETGNIGYYARTTAEISAAVVPTNFSYPPNNVLRYGAKGDDSTINDTAFAAAIAVAAASTSDVTITFPEGIYRISTSQNWYRYGIVLQAQGVVTIKSTASAGNVMVFDAGSGANGYLAKMLGNFILDTTNLGVGTGLFVRNVNHGEFNASIRNVTSVGCVVQGAVLTTFNITVSSTHGGAFTTTPANGITIDGSAIISQTTDCYFNLCIETCSDVGIVLTKCVASTFRGTSEGPPVAGGLNIGAAANNFDNLFLGFFFEGNSLRGDVDCSGSGNRFIACGAYTAPLAVTFTGAVLAGATTATLSANWGNPSGTYTVALIETTGGAPEIRSVVLTNGATSASWSGALVQNCNAAATTICVLFRNPGERNSWQGGTFASAMVMSGAINNQFWNFNSTDQVRDSGTNTAIWGRQPNLSVNILPAQINIQGTFSNLTYSGAWSNTSGTYQRAQIVKNSSSGEILVRGEAGGGVAGTVITVLPAGFRPSKSCSFICAGNNANNWASVIVDTAGNVTHVTGGYTTSLDLSTIRFFP